MGELPCCLLIALRVPKRVAWADPASNRVIEMGQSENKEGSLALKVQTPLRLFQPQPLPFSVVFNEDDASRLEGGAKLGDGGPLRRQRPGLSFKPAHRDVGDARRLGQGLLIPTEQHPASTNDFRG